MDDMVVKSESCDDHIQNLLEVFGTLRAVDMRLNPDKCVFNIEATISWDSC